MQIPQTLFSEMTRMIKGAQHVLLVSHKNPDSDSLGSALAFRALTDTLGIPATVLCVTPLAQELLFLPGAHEVLLDPRAVRARAPDVVVTFDAGDAPYAGIDIITSHLGYTPQIINIDHHASNTNFGIINCVQKSAASTAEIVYALLRAAHADIHRETALCLCAGVLTDTGTFSNPATTSRALHIVAELVRLGAPYALLVRTLERTRTLRVCALWGRALKRLRRHTEYSMATTVLFARDLEEVGADDNEAQGISNFLNDIQGIEVTLVLRETNDGKVKGSFRSTSDAVDLATLAELFGGGGHKKAAGFTIPGSIRETERGWEIV